MPSIKSRMNVDLKNYEPVERPAQAIMPQMPAPAMGHISPFMMSSLPPIAASLDLYQRQFYGRMSYPQQRVFTVSLT